jgi:hypothetical protein
MNGVGQRLRSTLLARAGPLASRKEAGLPSPQPSSQAAILQTGTRLQDAKDGSSVNDASHGD